MNADLDSTKVLCCAKGCGAGFAQEEPTQFHVHAGTGRGGTRGGLPEKGCEAAQPSVD
jgi:hypothetical protein